MIAMRRAALQILHGRNDSPENLALKLAKYIKNVETEQEARAGQREDVLRMMKNWQAPQAYQTAIRKRIVQLKALPDTIIFEAKATSPLLCGFDHNTTLEFGLAFLYSWGVPFLPGSGIKGCLSSYLQSVGTGDWSGTENQRGSAAAQLLGGKLDDATTVSGGVDFLDAWWIPGARSPFMTDIVTPHYSKYYAGGDSMRWPDGMENPIPFNFPAVRKGEKFLFALRGSAEWLTMVKTILTQALSEQGIGAKTRIGYGRFQVS